MLNAELRKATNTPADPLFTSDEVNRKPPSPVSSKYGIYCLLGEPNYRLVNSLLLPKHPSKHPQAAVWEQKQTLVNFCTPLLPRWETKYNVGNF